MTLTRVSLSALLPDLLNRFQLVVFLFLGHLRNNCQNLCLLKGILFSKSSSIFSLISLKIVKNRSFCFLLAKEAPTSYRKLIRATLLNREIYAAFRTKLSILLHGEGLHSIYCFIWGGGCRVCSEKSQIIGILASLPHFTSFFPAWNVCVVNGSLIILLRNKSEWIALRERPSTYHFQVCIL